MTSEIAALSAAAIAFLLTIPSPGHCLPFVAMARAGGWSRAKTAWITALCGHLAYCNNTEEHPWHRH